MTPTHSSTAHPDRSPALSQQLALTLAQAADDRKGDDILVLDVQEVSYLSDYFVIVTGFSRTQVRAIADAMQKAATELCQRPQVRIEGQADSSWIVLDYGDVIAHVMMPDTREFYDLEAFWGHARRLPFPIPSSMALENL